MNSLWLSGLLTLLLAVTVAAQDPKPAEGVPAPTNIRGRNTLGSTTTCA